MKHLLLTACACTAALTIGVSAQDSTATQEIKVKVDDAHTAVMTGCLVQEPGGSFMLLDATATVGDDLTVKTRTKTDVDGDETKVETKSSAKLDDARKQEVGTSGTTLAYLVTPRAGVNLQSHVGQRVEMAGVIVEAKKGGDDDATIKIEETTKLDREDAPDAKAKTTTKLEVPRGSQPVLTAISVKSVGSTCQ